MAAMVMLEQTETRSLELQRGPSTGPSPAAFPSALAVVLDWEWKQASIELSPLWNATRTGGGLN